MLLKSHRMKNCIFIFNGCAILSSALLAIFETPSSNLLGTALSGNLKDAFQICVALAVPFAIDLIWDIIEFNCQNGNKKRVDLIVMRLIPVVCLILPLPCGYLGETVKSASVTRLLEFWGVAVV